MPTPELDISPQQRRTRRSGNSQLVLNELEQLHGSLSVGDAFPSYRQLMKQLGASERAVVWALDELERQGKIVRRLGRAGAVVAEGKAILDGSQTALQEQMPSSLDATTRTLVAIAIPDRALFDQAMEVLVEQAKAEELAVLCHLLPASKDEAPSMPELQLPRDPVGFIVFRRELLPLAEKLHADGHRVVLLATPYADTEPQAPVVYGDQEYGGYLATQHLIELGHRRIAFCAFGDAGRTLRWQGHERALREATKRGLKIQDTCINLDEIKEAPFELGVLFRGSDAPTGLVVWNDHEAAILLGLLNRLGVRVPENVSIVGYDNLREGQFCYPALTTIQGSIEQQIRAALTLLTRPKAPSVPYQLVMQPTLIRRDSSAPISG